MIPEVAATPLLPQSITIHDQIPSLRMYLYSFLFVSVTFYFYFCLSSMWFLLDLGFLWCLGGFI